MDIVFSAPGQPDRWMLVFKRTTSFWWLRWLAVGRYKHVAAYAWLPATRQWLVYEIHLHGMTLVVLPDGAAAHEYLTAFTADADQMIMPRLGHIPGWRARFGFYCVPAIKHLIGLRSGALLPMTLWADCLRAGGKPLGRSADISADAAQRWVPATATAGPAGEHRGGAGYRAP